MNHACSDPPPAERAGFLSRRRGLSALTAAEEAQTAEVRWIPRSTYLVHVFLVLSWEYIINVPVITAMELNYRSRSLCFLFVTTAIIPSWGRRAESPAAVHGTRPTEALRNTSPTNAQAIQSLSRAITSRVPNCGKDLFYCCVGWNFPSAVVQTFRTTFECYLYSQPRSDNRASQAEEPGTLTPANLHPMCTSAKSLTFFTNVPSLFQGRHVWLIFCYEHDMSGITPLLEEVNID